MGVQLTIHERIQYECAATGESTYQLFCRAYRTAMKSEPNIQLIIGQVKGYLKTGVPPGPVYRLLS